jgi:hypothetical protein
MNLKKIAITATMAGALGAASFGLGAGSAQADPKWEPWEPWPVPEIPDDFDFGAPPGHIGQDLGVPPGQLKKIPGTPFF